MEKFITRKIFVVEHSAWRQMKENYQIYLPYQFHWRAQSVDWDAQLSHKKMKTMFLTNMSKSRRLTSTFFPIMLSHGCFSFIYSFLFRFSIIVQHLRNFIFFLLFYFLSISEKKKKTHFFLFFSFSYARSTCT